MKWRLADVRGYGLAWQDRLKIPEWEITWRWMTKPETEAHPEWNGYAIWNEQHKSAVISLHKTGENIPHTIIHELFHIRMLGHAAQRATDIPTEVATNALADALLALEGIYGVTA